MAIRVERDLVGKMRHVISIGPHRVVVDEPPENGGEDAGPTPHQLYDAALGACKALTVLWYAQRNEIPLTTVEIAVERDDSREREGLYRLRAELSLGGELSPAQRERLLAVASRCPVHKLMTSVETQIETVLK